MNWIAIGVIALKALMWLLVALTARAVLMAFFGGGTNDT